VQTRNYSDYLTRVADMIGLPSSGMTDAEKGFLNSYFNTNVRTAWQSNNFLDVCPYGEARFAGNDLHAVNKLADTTYWTFSFAAASDAQLANPLDGRVTAAKFFEDTATAEHYESQSVTFVPGATYTASTYARTLGGRHLYLKVNDGVNTYTCFFDLTSGTVGTSSSNLLTTPTISQQANGFWLCQYSFTASTSATTGYFRLQTSSNGSTLNYAGSTSAGLYLWGNLLQQTTLAAPSSFIIPYEQEDEEEIDAVFNVWRTSPLNASYPAEQAYQLGRTGIQLIADNGNNSAWSWGTTNYATAPANPVFLYYRKEPTDYTGEAYDENDSYAVGETMLYTDADGVSNFYTCLVAASAGQTPDTHPASWDIHEIPEVFFQYALRKGYADWLRMDGQFDKAAAQDRAAEDALDAQHDKQERQQGFVLPMKVSTHATSQAR
jgi:hypothetical protein